jgi:hypothetical protein
MIMAYITLNRKKSCKKSCSNSIFMYFCGKIEVK